MIVTDAQFYDGKTPTPQRVQIVSSEEGIQILSPDEGLIMWDYSILREQGSDLIENRMVVSPANDPSKFLSFEHTDLIAIVREKAKGNLQKQFEVGGEWLQKLWAVLGAVAVVILLMIYVIIPYSAKYISPAIPYSFESRIGASGEEDLLALIELARNDNSTPFLCEKQSDILPIRMIIEDLQQSILTASQGDENLLSRIQEIGDIEIKIVNSDIINAFALPGGRILVFRGLLEKAVDDYDTLGVILAHEMAHVMKRHNMQGLIANSATSIILEPLGSLFGIPDLFQLTEAAFVADYTLTMEKEADKYSVPWAVSAGLDPSKAAGFFEYLQQQKKEDEGDELVPEALANIFQTHPSDYSRIIFYKDNANPYAKNKYGDYKSWLKRLETSCPQTLSSQ